MNKTTRWFLIALLAGGMLLTAGTAGVAATEGEGTSDEVRIADEEIEIAGGTVTVSDVNLSGPGLGDKHVDHAKYTVEDATVTFDGITVTAGGTDYEIANVEVTIEEVGVVFEDVNLESG